MAAPTTETATPATATPEPSTSTPANNPAQAAPTTAPTPPYPGFDRGKIQGYYQELLALNLGGGPANLGNPLVLKSYAAVRAMKEPGGPGAPGGRFYEFLADQIPEFHAYSAARTAAAPLPSPRENTERIYGMITGPLNELLKLNAITQNTYQSLIKKTDPNSSLPKEQRVNYPDDALELAAALRGIAAKLTAGELVFDKAGAELAAHLQSLLDLEGAAKIYQDFHKIYGSQRLASTPPAAPSAVAPA